MAVTMQQQDRAGEMLCSFRQGPAGVEMALDRAAAAAVPVVEIGLQGEDQGAMAVKDAPKRYEATKALIARMGGRLVCAYVTTGQYDVVLVVEMPNGDAMTQLSVAITSSGNARTTTVRAFAPEEFGKLAAEAPKMT